MRLRPLFALLVLTSAPSWAIERIVSLSPHTTELAFSAGLGDKLIGVSEYSDYPDQAQRIERVANYQGFKLERIIALEPDLILAWPGGNPAKELDKLAQLGFEIYYSQAHSIPDIADNIERLGQFADDPSVAKQRAEQFRQTLNDMAQRYDTSQPVRYFYQLSESPIISVAQGNWPSEVFTFCGGVNVFEDAAMPYPQVGMEQVLLANPEVIFTSEHAIANGSMWQRWQSELTAVQANNVWSLHSDWINRPTMRTLKAIEQVCDYFQQAREKR